MDFNHTIRLNPENPHAFYDRGCAKAQLYRHEEAIADFDQTIRLNPENPHAFYDRGCAKAQLYRHEEAIADFDQTIRLNPKYSYAYYHRGRAKAQLGRHEEAIADFSYALKLNSDNAEFYYNRAHSKARLGQRKEATKDYDQAICFDTRNLYIYPDFNVRVVDDNILPDGSLSFLSFKKIEIIGLLPIAQTTNLTAVTTVLDITDNENPMQVISLLRSFREPDSTVFMNVQEIGKIKENSGFKNWVETGRIYPSYLQTPETGRRKLAVNFFLIDSDNPPLIKMGDLNHSDKSGLKYHKKFTFEHKFLQKGYIETSKDIDEARGIAVKIALSVAIADGSLDTCEETVIKKWIKKVVATYTDDKRKYLEEIYNGAMKSAFLAAKKGDLLLSDLTKRLNTLNERKIKYDAIDLCYEVMAADGVADAEELKTIRMVGEALELDIEELEKLHDRKLVSLPASAITQTSVEEILGIKENWDETKIKSYLVTEFQKWNNMLNTLPEKDRENAQFMLHKIAEAREKYGI